MSSIAPSSSAAPSTIRTWAIVALVLTLLCLPMSGVGLFQLAASPLSATRTATVYTALIVLNFALGVAFLDGAVGTLRGRGWGRWTLAGAAAVALPAIAVGAVLTVLQHNDPAVAQAMKDTMLKSPQVASMPPEALQQAVTVQTAFMFFGGLAMAAVQFVYCIALWRAMTAGSRAATR